MTDQQKQDKTVLSIRISSVMETRLQRVKTRLDTQSTSEVFRRALELLADCLESDQVELVAKDGQRTRVKLH